MTNGIWNKYKEEAMNGTLAAQSGNVFKAILVNGAGSLPSLTDPAPVRGSISNLNIGGDGTGAVIEQTLNGCTFTMGVFETTDNQTVFTAVTDHANTAASADHVVVFNSTTARLMCVIELGTLLNFNGSNVTIDWDDASVVNGQTGGIFAF